MTTESIKVNADIEIKITRSKSGKIESKTHYVEGKKHGLETWRRNSGEKWREKMWKKGKEHGMDIEWWGVGHKEREIMWSEGKQHGLEIRWGEDGTQWYERMCRDGKLHGLETRWYEDGTKEREIYYFQGKEYIQIYWAENGDLDGIQFSPLPITHPTPSTTKRKTKKIISPHN